MGQRAENQLRFAQGGVFGRGEGQLSSAHAHGLTTLTMSGGKSQLQVRMLSDEQAELASRVSAGTKDADRKFMHE